MIDEIWKLVSANKIKLPGTQWSLIGYSAAKRNTFLYIPELGIAFDAGLATNMNPTHIFISHAHLDHTGELFRYIIEPANGTVTVVMPKPSAHFIKNFVHSSIQMTKHNSKVQPDWNPIEVSVSTIKTIEPLFLSQIMIIKNFRFKIELFKCTHSVATTGYGFIELRSKLKNEFKNMSQHELDELVHNNVMICEDVKISHFCYLGDTDHRVLYENTECTIYNRNLEKYRTIMIECTFLNIEEERNAKKNKHMLWNNLRPYIADHPDQLFILYHFSLRYRPREIIKFFKDAGYTNIIPLVTDTTSLYVEQVKKLIMSGDEDVINEIFNKTSHQLPITSNTLSCVNPLKMHEHSLSYSPILVDNIIDPAISHEIDTHCCSDEEDMLEHNSKNDKI